MQVSWVWTPQLEELDFFLSRPETLACDVLAFNLGLHPLHHFGRALKNDLETMDGMIDRYSGELALLLKRLHDRWGSKRIPLVCIETHHIRYTRIFSQEYYYTNATSVEYWNASMRRVLGMFGIPILSSWEMSKALDRSGYRDAIHVVSHVNEMKSKMFFDFLVAGGLEGNIET